MCITYLVDLCQVVNLLYIVLVIVHRVCNREKPHVRGALQRSLQLGCILQLFQPTDHFEPSPSGINHANGFLQALFKRPADGHDFADTLHGATDFTVDFGTEFREIPLRDFGYDVVERWLEACSSSFCDGVGQLGKCMSQSNFGSCVGKGVPCRLGSQCG